MTESESVPELGEIASGAVPADMLLTAGRVF
jgi:hypothetical protein